jgi:hypothetical protein
LQPRARDERGRDPRAQATAGQQRGIPRRHERRNTERVRRSLRMKPGYDERDDDCDYLGETPHPL